MVRMDNLSAATLLPPVFGEALTAFWDFIQLR